MDSTLRGKIYGQSEIRTHEALSHSPVFKTGALNHSAICPVKLYDNLAKKTMGDEESNTYIRLEASNFDNKK